MGLNMNHVGRLRDKKMLHAMIVAVLIKTRSRSRRMRRAHTAIRASAQFDPVTALLRRSVSRLAGSKIGLYARQVPRKGHVPLMVGMQAADGRRRGREP
jgi:hypothetical protein